MKSEEHINTISQACFLWPIEAAIQTVKPTPSKNGSKSGFGKEMNNGLHYEMNYKFILLIRKIYFPSGIADRISTAWENVKRMLGFAPDCHNGKYKNN